MTPTAWTDLEWVEALRRDLLPRPPKAPKAPKAPLTRRPRRRPPTDFAKCGTPGNYRKHLREGEKPCLACRQAESRRQADVRARGRANQESAQRVRTALVDWRFRSSI